MPQTPEGSRFQSQTPERWRLMTEIWTSCPCSESKSTSMKKIVTIKSSNKSMVMQTKSSPLKN
jgi:hypothetical protein